MLLNLHPGKAFQLADMIAETFPVPRATLDEAVRTIVGAKRPASSRWRLALPGKAEWTDVRAALTKAIVASATPERDDRLFPGDIAQFQPGGGINLATGAAGVLYALARTGAGRFPEYDDWLRKHALDTADRPRPVRRTARRRPRPRRARLPAGRTRPGRTHPGRRLRAPASWACTPAWPASA